MLNKIAMKEITMQTGYFETKVPLLVAIEHRSVISLTVCRDINFFVTYEAVQWNLSTKNKKR